MVYLRHRLALGLATVLLLASACVPVTPMAESTASGTVATEQQASTLLTDEAISEEEALLDEYAYDSVVDQPEHHLIVAREMLAQGEQLAASAHLRKAAGYMRLEALRAPTDSQMTLPIALFELDVVAQQVVDGTIATVADLDPSIARAEVALAEHHIALAHTHDSAEKFAEAGLDLHHAVVYLESAARHSGFTWGDQARQILDDAMAYVNGVSMGDHEASAEATRAHLESVAREITAVAEALPSSELIVEVQPIGVLEIVSTLVDEPEYHLQRAAAALAEDMPAAAADSIRIAAAYLQLERTQAAETAYADLALASDRLIALAVELDADMDVPETKLHDAFAQAEYVLAQDRQLLAAQAWSANDGISAGQFLNDAAYFLTQGDGWLDSTATEHALATVENAQRISAQMMAGESVSAADVDAIIDAIGAEIAQAITRVETQEMALVAGTSAPAELEDLEAAAAYDELTEEIEHHFQAAHEASADKADAGLAASHIRTAAAFIKQEAQRAHGVNQARLLTNARELDGLAGEVAAGYISSPESLDKPFTFAEHALAAHFHDLAQRAQERGALDQAARHLQAAMGHMTSAADRNGHELSDLFANIVKALEDVMGGEAIQPDTLAERTEQPGRELADLGAKVQAPEEQTSEADVARVPVLEIVSVTYKEPEYHFQLAHDARLENKLKTAASDLRVGAALLLLEQTRAPEAVRAEMKAAFDDLHQMATELDNGTAVPIDQVDYALARTEYALAHNHQIQADQAWAEGRTEAAGHYMESALFHWASGSRWFGATPSAEINTALENVDSVSQVLMAGELLDDDDIAQALAALGQAIEQATASDN